MWMKRLSLLVQALCLNGVKPISVSIHQQGPFEITYASTASYLTTTGSRDSTSNGSLTDVDLPPSEELQNRFEIMLCRWVIETMQPFNVVCHESFSNLIRVFGSYIHIPSRQTLQRRLLKMEGTHRAKVLSILQKKRGEVSLTTDP